MRLPTHRDRLIALLLLSLALASTIGCRTEGIAFSERVYRTVDGNDLRAHIFSPSHSWWQSDRAAIVIFHGGAWKAGGPELAHPHCRYLAERGMVAVAAQYRLADGGDVTPLDAMEDARELIRWLRANAGEFHVDPQRIAAGGWSAGGHLAAMAAISEDDASNQTRSTPDALALWFPSVAPHNDKIFLGLLQEKADPETLSPVRLVRAGLPPTVIFQGGRDRTTPLAPARAFCEQMVTEGNRCEIHVYKGRGHVFTHQVDDYVDTMTKADAFLGSLDFLDGSPDPELIRRVREELVVSPVEPGSP